eukprot:jgi/Botrbrau1/13469/Bobra.0082s0068.2
MIWRFPKMPSEPCQSFKCGLGGPAEGVRVLHGGDKPFGTSIDRFHLEATMMSSLPIGRRPGDSEAADKPLRRSAWQQSARLVAQRRAGLPKAAELLVQCLVSSVKGVVAVLAVSNVWALGVCGHATSLTISQGT